MTKKELIEFLVDYPDDIDIYIDKFNDDDYKNTNLWVSDVRDIREIKLIRRIQDMKIAQRACKETSGAKKCIIL